MKKPDEFSDEELHQGSLEYGIAIVFVIVLGIAIITRDETRVTEPASLRYHSLVQSR